MPRDLRSATGRAVLIRISTLLGEHRTRDAQALWDWALSQDSPIVLGTVPAAPDTVAAVLRERASIEEARLLLRQDDDAYHDAIDLLNGVEHRIDDAQTPTLTGDRRERVRATLAAAYASAGRIPEATRVTERVLNVRLSAIDTSRDELRRILQTRVSPMRAADAFHVHATRLVRLADMTAVVQAPGARADAERLLNRAAACIDVAAEQRGSRYGILLERGLQVRVALQRARWQDDPTHRRAALVAVVDDARRLLADSTAAPEVMPQRQIAAQALYGSALLALANTHETSDPATAQLATVCLAPEATVHEINVDYTLVTLLRYADACALVGNLSRARRAWERVRQRAVRVHENPRRPGVVHADGGRLVAALDARLESGRVPPRWSA